MGRASRHKRERRQPVIIAGDGIVARSLGQAYEAKPHAKLPAKRPGEHRWVAMGTWVVTNVTGMLDPDQMKLLDHENLMGLGLGCWDCEQPLGQIEPGSLCPAGASDD